MQDIINTNSAKATQTIFNTFIDIKSIANFYAISFIFLLAYYNSEKNKDLTIKDDINQLLDNLAL